MTTFSLPDLGEGLHDAEIVAWHVSVGDRVVADQPLVSVETDKAVVEVPSPWSGEIAKIHVGVGEMVPIGAALVDIGESVAQDPGAVVGAIPDQPPPPAALASAREPRRLRAAASPAVRNRARALGVDLHTVAGSGPDRAILMRDIETVAQSSSHGGWTPVRGVRRAMARNMAKANAEVATTTVVDDADVSNWPDDADVTIRLVDAIVSACRAEPALNAWYDGTQEVRRLNEQIDLGLAVDTDEGLFAPVLRDVGARSQSDLREGLNAMKRDLATRAVPREHLADPTVTLSNFGTIGGRYASLAIVPPQVAILGAGRIAEQPRIVDGDVVARRMMPLSLSFDHRVVTGAEAMRFLLAAISRLER